MNESQTMMSKKVAALIKQLGLEKHPEGGWYKETYRSSENISSNT